MKTSKKTVHINQLVVDFALNQRDPNNYDIGSLIPLIKDMGRILKPIVVKAHPTEKDKFVPLQGNRRTLAGQAIYKEADITVEMKAALDKVEVLVVSDFTEHEENVLIFDQGGEKPISRAEIVKAVWRLDKAFLKEAEIIQTLYFVLARYTRNEGKLHEVPKNEPERSKFLKGWFHGTVGNQILAAARMGEFVKGQFLKTRLSEDKLLPDGDKLEMRCDTKRITELSQAITADKKAAKDAGKPESEGWSYDKGGLKFNELIEKFKHEDETGERSSTPSRPTVKELQEKMDQYRSSPIKKALAIAAGNNELGKGLADDDEHLYYLEMKLEVLHKFAKDIKDDKVRELVGALLHGAPGGVQEALKPFIS
jgi:hypothetical protein